MHAAHGAVAVIQKFIGAALNPLGGVGIRRAAVGRIVLEAAVFRGVVRGGDDDAVTKALRAARVPGEDGVRNDRGGGVAAALLDDRGHAVGGQHFQRGAVGGFRQSVGVHAEEQRAGYACLRAVFAHRLGDGEDVFLVEAAGQRAAPVAGCAEGHAPLGRGGIRVLGIIGGDQRRNVHQLRSFGPLPGLRMRCHGVLLS